MGIVKRVNELGESWLVEGVFSDAWVSGYRSLCRNLVD